MMGREFMNREVATLRPEDPIREGARSLMKSCESALPVVNGAGSIVGMFADEDLLIRLRNRGLSLWQMLFAEACFSPLQVC